MFFESCDIYFSHLSRSRSPVFSDILRLPLSSNISLLVYVHIYMYIYICIYIYIYIYMYIYMCKYISLCTYEHSHIWINVYGIHTSELNHLQSLVCELALTAGLSPYNKDLKSVKMTIYTWMEYTLQRFSHLQSLVCRLTHIASPYTQNLEWVYMTIATQNTTPPKSTKSRNSDSSVSCVHIQVDVLV